MTDSPQIKKSRWNMVFLFQGKRDGALECLFLVGFFCTMSFVLVACSTGHCRRDGSGKVLEKINPQLPMGYEIEDSGHVTVAKPDGSLQCEMRPGFDLDQMAREQLVGIQILSSSKQNDGFMGIPVCGGETGLLNTYTIHSRDWVKAQRAGFFLLKDKN